MKHSPRDAFTLVEILVVLGILAVLIAILMPALSNARYQARLTACAANLQQIGQAATMYASDHRGKFLRIDASVNTACNGWDVGNAMYDAMRSDMGLPQQSLFCPDSPEDLISSVWDDFNPNFKILGYSWWTPRQMNGILFPPTTSVVPGLVVNDPKSAGPSRLGDPLSNDNPIVTDAVITVGTLPWPQGYSSPNDQWTSHRRNGKPDVQNQLYADGHVERKAVSELSPRYAQATSGNWQWR